MIFKWLHNRKYKENPMCPCGWRMLSTTRQHFSNYWKCKFEQCTWEAFTKESYRVKFWRS